MVRKKEGIAAIFFISFLVVSTSVLAAEPLLDANDVSPNGNSYGQLYTELVNELFAGRAVMTIEGNKMWVPWFSSSSNLDESNLQDGNSCNAQVDWEHNCMVTDEFSQVGILVSMGTNQERMDQFYNTVRAISSTNGDIPAWRVYRNGNNIEPCRDGINGNCDSASDATARIIIALYTASDNPYFNNEAQKQDYKNLADTLASQMVEFEIEKTCRPSDLGYGDICYWLASGSEAKRGGLSSWDYTYSGYFQDAIIAMLQACSQTGDGTYCEVADHLTLNFLQAANYDGDFSVPPGRSFQWTNTGGVPEAQCTGSCNPVVWDDADATRAVGMCQALYYADAIDHELPELQNYCDLWGNEYMSNPSQAPIQYYPNGDGKEMRSGFFSQGLQSLFLAGQNPGIYEETLDNALEHYNSDRGTWDWHEDFGVYHQAFPMRSLGVGLGRTLPSFSQTVDFPTIPSTGGTSMDNGGQDDPGDGDAIPTDDTNTDSENTDGDASSDSGEISEMGLSCSIEGSDCTVSQDNTAGACREVQFNTGAGTIQVLGCDKGDHFEVYRQSYPSGTEFEVCLGQGCIDENGGFASFEGTSGSVGNTGSDQQTTDNEETFNDQAGIDTSQEEQTQENTGTGIGSLSVSCSAVGGCSVVGDVVSGVCRSVVFSSGVGDIEVLGCDKGGHYEVYRQSSPNTQFEACIGGACVDNVRGFDRSSSDALAGSTKTQTSENTGEQTEDDTNQNDESSQEEPTESSSGISSLTPSCSAVGGCSVMGDVVSGVCRSVVFSSGVGDIEVLGCDKGGHYEVYRQSYPSGTDFEVCLGQGCVDDVRGFDRSSQ